MNKIKVEFGFGTGLDKSGQNIPFAQIERGVENICKSVLRMFGGYTRYWTQGGWKDLSDGKVFIEHGATVVAYLDPEDAMGDDKIANVVAVIKAALNQRAVYVTRTLVDTELM
jgi:hypothetical protein